MAPHPTEAPMIRPLAALALLAGPATAQDLPWDGTYRLSEGADCERVGEEGGALRIEDGVLTGVESICRMTDPVDVLDLDATLERAMLMEAAEGDGIFILWRGYAFRYERCPEPG
jgi:hypothetical protein